jgi:excisionase family DNA binding protein
MLDDNNDNNDNSKVLNLLRIKEAAEYLGVHTDTLRRWDNCGKLKCYRHPINKYRLFKLGDLKKVLSGILLDEE